MVFGGLHGLEAAVDADPNLEVAEPSVLFDLYVNTCPSQGSRTIRTEVSPPASPASSLLFPRISHQPGLRGLAKGSYSSLPVTSCPRLP